LRYSEVRCPRNRGDSIAATNHDPQADIAAGRFREDLFYRLSVLEIYLPPLRDRREDLPLLYRCFLDDFNERFQKGVRGFSKRAQEAVMRWSWPGNVRELQNVIERACILSQRDFVDLEELPRHLQEAASIRSTTAEPGPETTLAEVERRHVLRVLQDCSANRSEAARRLGISRRTLQRKLQLMSREGESRTQAISGGW